MQTEVTTDVVKATLSSTGATLVRLELLKYPDHVVHEWYEPLLELLGRKADKPAPKDVVLLDQSPNRLYVAESGLVPAAGGSGLPNHHTAMQLVPGERTLAPGQNALQVKYESPPVGGVKLVRTYTFKRGDYVVDVKNEVVNESGAAVSPRLYLQLVRDGVPPPGESSFYFTFTGPAIDDGSKFQKVEFKDIEKRERVRQARSHRRVRRRLGGDGPALFRRGLADRQGRHEAAARILHRQGRDRQSGHRKAGAGLLGRHAGAARRDRPGRDPEPSTPSCSSGRRKRTSSPSWRRDSSW